jgi:hypothetical protein
MEIILSEMMVSLGWDEPEYRLLCCEGGMYAHTIELQPIGEKAERIIVEGPKEASEEEATANVAKVAILQLEKLLSICLIDLNYNTRTPAEKCVAEAKSVLQNISCIILDALSEWEEEVESLSISDDYCRAMMAKHDVGGMSSEEYNIKWKHAEAVAELYNECLAALKLGRRRHNCFADWIDNQ